MRRMRMAGVRVRVPGVRSHTAGRAACVRTRGEGMVRVSVHAVLPRRCLFPVDAEEKQLVRYVCLVGRWRDEFVGV